VSELWCGALIEVALTYPVGTGYYMNAVSWVAGMLIAGGVFTTGISADKGKLFFAHIFLLY